MFRAEGCLDPHPTLVLLNSDQTSGYPESEGDKDGKL